jgi:hypothetical protein
MLPADSGGGGGLFLAPIPVPPGDPAALSAAAGTYTAAHGEIERDQAVMARAASNDSETAWIGVGAFTFAAVSSELAAAYTLTANALAKGAAALRAYATALTTAQETARRANDEIAAVNATASALLAAEATARASQDAAGQASQDASTAAAHAAASPHSPAAAHAADTAQTAATDAQNTATSDANTVAALTARYDTERAQALKLIALAKQQATTAANQAATGFDDATLGLLGNKPKPAKGGAKGVDGSPWEGLTEVVEKTHTSLGLLAADGILWAMGKGAEQAAEFMKDLPKLEQEWLHEVLPWGKNASDGEWAAAVSRWWNKSDAAEAFGQEFVDSTSTLGLISRIGRVGGGAVALFGDGLTIADPPQAGVMGNVDRGVAIVNAGVVGVDTVGAIGTLAGIDAISFSVPPVGVAVAVGTGLYLSGAYLYKHWGFFRNDIANPVGHAFADVGKGAYHGASHLVHDILSVF